MTSRGNRPGQFAVCIDNGEYDADLIAGKIYRVVKPKRNSPGRTCTGKNTAPFHGAGE